MEIEFRYKLPKFYNTNGFSIKIEMSLNKKTKPNLDLQLKNEQRVFFTWQKFIFEHALLLCTPYLLVNIKRIDRTSCNKIFKMQRINPYQSTKLLIHPFPGTGWKLKMVQNVNSEISLV